MLHLRGIKYDTQCGASGVDTTVDPKLVKCEDCKASSRYQRLIKSLAYADRIVDLPNGLRERI